MGSGIVKNRYSIKDGYNFERGETPAFKPLNSKDFKEIKVIGRGSFGKVILVQMKSTKEYYAMKVYVKKKVVELKVLDEVKMEKFFMSGISHPFIVELKYVFHDDKKIYFIMQFVRGGNLEYHLDETHNFSEKRVKLYAAELFLAISYLHWNSIIFRDLKLSNVILDHEGHCVLTDFGLAVGCIKKRHSHDKNDFFQRNEVAGTVLYMPPEMIDDKSKGYDQCADWWTYGICLYEMLYGITPFEESDNLFEITQSILNDGLEFPDSLDNEFDEPIEVSNEAKDFISLLLIKDPRHRLGSKNEDDIKNHPFFRSIDFTKVFLKQYKPEFIPEVKNARDFTNFITPFLDRLNFTSRSNSRISRRSNISWRSNLSNFSLRSNLSSRSTKNKIKKKKIIKPQAPSFEEFDI